MNADENIWQIPTDNAKIIATIASGDVLAYPTEAVFALGGDPSNAAAVAKIIHLKSRAAGKAFLIVASDWQQCCNFVALPSLRELKIMQRLNRQRATTFVLPALATVDHRLLQRDNIAVRISTHPLVVALCSLLERPLISTSANKSLLPAARSIAQVRAYFDKIPIICGALGNDAQPSRIIDWSSKKILRN